MEQRYGTDPSRRYGTGVWNGGMERVWSRSLFRTSYFDLHPYMYIYTYILSYMVVIQCSPCHSISLFAPTFPAKPAWTCSWHPDTNSGTCVGSRSVAQCKQRSLINSVACFVCSPNQKDYRSPSETSWYFNLLTSLTVQTLHFTPHPSCG